MFYKIIKWKFKPRLNILLVFVLLILSFALFYFLYNRQRSQSDVYISIIAQRPSNPGISSLPFWMADSIYVGDKEINPFNQKIAEVVDIDQYEVSVYGVGKIVTLTLKINATKDRSGTLIYKNKPLLIGGNIDLKLSKVQLSGVINYIGNNPPHYKSKNLKIIVKTKNAEPWIADGIKIGDRIVNSKGEEIVRVINKTVTNAQIRSVRADGQAVTTYDTTKRDLTLELQITATESNNLLYLMNIQKIKLNENIYLPFPSITLYTFITEIKNNI